MSDVQAQFKCCGNEAWIYEGKKLPPCPTCGKVWVGREEKDERGCVRFFAEEED